MRCFLMRKGPIAAVELLTSGTDELLVEQFTGSSLRRPIGISTASRCGTARDVCTSTPKKLKIEARLTAPVAPPIGAFFLRSAVSGCPKRRRPTYCFVIEIEYDLPDRGCHVPSSFPFLCCISTVEPDPADTLTELGPMVQDCAEGFALFDAMSQWHFPSVPMTRIRSGPSLLLVRP